MDKIVIFGKTQGFESYEIDLLERSEGVKNIYTHPKVLPLENGQFMLHYSFSRETACLSLYTRVINLGSERDGLIFGVAYKSDKNFDLLTVLNNILYPLYRGASTLLLNEDKDKIIHESIVEVLEREIYSQISNWGIKPCVSTSMAESPDSGKIRMLLVSSDKNFQDISNIQSTIKDYSDVYICKYPEVFKSDINSVALRSCKGKITYPVTPDNPPPKPPIDGEEYDIVFKTLISPVESDFDFIVKNTYPLNALRFELIGGRNIAKINGSRLIINPNRENREVENVYIQVSYNGKILKGVSYDIAPRRRRPLPIVLISSVIAVIAIAISIATLFIIEKSDTTPVVIPDSVEVKNSDRGILPAPPDLKEEKKFVFTIENKPINKFMFLVNNQTTYSKGEYYFKVVEGVEYVTILSNKLIVIQNPTENNAEVIIEAYDNKTNKKIASQKYWIAKKEGVKVSDTKQDNRMAQDVNEESKPEKSKDVANRIKSNYVLRCKDKKGRIVISSQYTPKVKENFSMELFLNDNGTEQNFDSNKISWKHYPEDIFEIKNNGSKTSVSITVKSPPEASQDIWIRCYYDEFQVAAASILRIQKE